MKIQNILVILGLSFLFACSNSNSSDFKEDVSGLKYRFLKKENSEKKAFVGAVLNLQMKFYDASDSLLFNTEEIMGDFWFQLPKPSHGGGSFEDGLLLMNEGDSLEFFVNAKNFFKFSQKNEIPQNVSDTSFVHFFVKINTIFSEQEFVAYKADLHEERTREEDMNLKQYLIIQKITEKPTESGLYFLSHEEGNGLQIAENDIVTIHYVIKFLDGTVFDDTKEREKPFKFVVGDPYVIDGLNEGVKLMKNSGKATLITPSKLAYGVNGFETFIAPYTTLIFEVEIIEVEKF